MLKNQKGFSLVELMIVVAIIGILAAIAIPNFQKFQEKAKQSEAKLSLAGIYTGEKALYAEYTAYASGLDVIGFAPDGIARYNVGFSTNVNPPLPVPRGGTSCFSSCPSNAVPTACLTGFITWQCTMNNATAEAVPTTAIVNATYTTFQAGAASLLNASATADVWTMDNTQTLQNATSGL